MGPGEHYECNFARYGDMLGHLSNIMRQVGDKMETKSANMSHDSDQEREDEPT